VSPNSTEFWLVPIRIFTRPSLIAGVRFQDQRAQTKSVNNSPYNNINNQLDATITTQSSAPEDGRNYRPKHVELMEITNELLLLHLVGCLYYFITHAQSHRHQMNNSPAQIMFLVLLLIFSFLRRRIVIWAAYFSRRLPEHHAVWIHDLFELSNHSDAAVHWRARVICFSIFGRPREFAKPRRAGDEYIRGLHVTLGTNTNYMTPIQLSIFPPVQTSPGAHPASCKMGTGSFPGVKCGQGVLLTTHPLLVPRSWKSSYTYNHPLGHTEPVTGTYTSNCLH